MRSRWVLRGLIIVVLVCLVFWIAQNTYWEEIPIPQPLQGEAARNPFYTASRLAAELAARPHWQRVFTSTPPQDAVLVASEWNWGLFPTRRERLQRWVASGGRLVVDRSLIGGPKELQTWAGIERYALNQSALKNLQDPFDRCPTLSADRPAGKVGRAQSFHVCGLDRRFGLRVSRKTSWMLRDSNSTVQALRVPIGLGSITFVNSVPFTNRTLLEGDNAALFVAATQLHRGDAIWFVTEERSASLLWLTWKTGAPVVLLMLALIVAWLWRASTRFGPPLAPAEAARRSLAEQIRGTGQFTLRFGDGQALHAAEIRALQEAAEQWIPGYARLSSEQRLEHLAQRVGVPTPSLAVALNPAAPRRQAELRQRLAMLEHIRRTLSITPQHRERS